MMVWRASILKDINLDLFLKMVSAVLICIIIYLVVLKADAPRAERLLSWLSAIIILDISDEMNGADISKNGERAREQHVQK